MADFGLTLLILWHTWRPYEPKKTPPTHRHHWFIIIVRLGAIPSVFAWVITSSDTWTSLWLRISCYSWCLPTPKWLGATEEHWHELVIVRGHLPVIARGLVPSPMKSWKVTLVNCSCHWVTSLVGRFLRRQVLARWVIPISHRIVKCWSTQRGLACRQAREPWEKNLMSIVIEILLVIDWIFVDWFISLATVV
jgi:hypothetical protein